MTAEHEVEIYQLLQMMTFLPLLNGRSLPRQRIVSINYTQKITVWPYVGKKSFSHKRFELRAVIISLFAALNAA